MATQIVIFNEEAIKIDDSFHIDWADKGIATLSQDGGVVKLANYLEL